MKKLFVIAIAAVTLTTMFACGGKESSASTENNPAPSAPEDITADNSANGEEVYKKTCIACHQANGEGIANTFPPLAKSDFLSNKEQVIEQVIKGKTGEMVVNGLKYNNTMPPQNLSDAEIAAVLTYVYSSWGNTGGPISLDEVKAVREKSH